MQQLSAEHGSAPTSMREYEVGGKKYIVISHYAGKKNLGTTMQRLAAERAYTETMSGNFSEYSCKQRKNVLQCSQVKSDCFGLGGKK